MIDPRWYDKIAAAQAEAEEVLMNAAAEDAAAEDMENAALTDAAVDEVAAEESDGLIAKLQEDIQIAQEVAATDLPTDVKVEILVNNGVDEAIIDDVIDAEATDAVAAYYGLDPHWLHDKRAAAAAEATKAAMPVARRALHALKNYGRNLTGKTSKKLKEGANLAFDRASMSVGKNREMYDAAGQKLKSLASDAVKREQITRAATGLGVLGLGNAAYFGGKAIKGKEDDSADFGAYASNPNTAALLGGGAGALGGAALGGLIGGGKGALAGGLTGAGLGGAAGYAFGPDVYERYGKK